MADGLLVSKLCGCAVTCAFGVLDRLLPDRRPASEEVVGNLGQMRLRVRGVEHLERLSDRTVQAHPPRRWDALVESIPDQDVREAQSPGCVGRAGEQSR